MPRQMCATAFLRSKGSSQIPVCASWSDYGDDTTSCQALPCQHQHMQLLVAKRAGAGSITLPDELAAVQTPCCQPHTYAVVHQHLHSVCRNRSLF